MPDWLILALWGSASVFVAWLALVSEIRKRAKRKQPELTEHEKLLAEAYPDLAPQ